MNNSAGSSISRTTNEEAERISGENIGFSFGENWRKYLSAFEDSTITYAENSFTGFSRLSRLEGHSFLDIGCGSGLSSLIAYRLGAKRIVSIDIDPNSIECVEALRKKYATGITEWDIFQGSVLNREFLTSLGRFSYVYSWGVLHHTGSMWQALDNVIHCVESGGKLHIALYNEHRNSARWLKIKRICNRWPRTALPLIKASYGGYAYARVLAQFQSPPTSVRQYRMNRGMSFWRDIEDWVGGLPYEYCKPDEVVDFLSERSFVLLRLRTAGSKGCNEFLFRAERGSGGNA